MASLQLEVVTPDAVVIGCEADYVGVPGVEGEFGVLAGHIPFLSALAIGGLYYKADGVTKYVFISGGFAEISNNKVSILAEAAEEKDKIDLERAQSAKKRAEERLAAYKQGADDIDAVRAEAALVRAVSRMHVGGVL